MPSACALLLALASVVAPVAASSVPVLADEVAAVVERRPVLLSELELHARLRRGRRSGAAAMAGPLSREEWTQALDAVLDSLVVFLEAERLQLFAPSPGDVRAAVADLRRQLGAVDVDRFLRESGFDARTLEESLGRELRVQRYLEGRFRLAARPRELQLRRYWADHPEEWNGRTLAEAAGELRARLTAERYGQLTTAFVAELRRRSPVDVRHNFDVPGSGLPTRGSARASGDAP